MHIVIFFLPINQFLSSQVNGVLLSCRGVVRVDINLQDVDIDQCSTDGWFAGTHRCNLTTMEVSVPNTRIRQKIDLLRKTEL